MLVTGAVRPACPPPKTQPAKPSAFVTYLLDACRLRLQNCRLRFNKRINVYDLFIANGNTLKIHIGFN